MVPLKERRKKQRHEGLLITKDQHLNWSFSVMSWSPCLWWQRELGKHGTKRRFLCHHWAVLYTAGPVKPRALSGPNLYQCCHKFVPHIYDLKGAKIRIVNYRNRLLFKYYLPMPYNFMNKIFNFFFNLYLIIFFDDEFC